MSLGNTLLNYLGSAKNIAGCALGAGASAAVLYTGAAGSLWPVVAAASYGIGAVIMPTRKRIIDAPRLDAVYTAEQLREAIEEDRALVPAPLKEKAMPILAGLAEIVGHWDVIQQNPNVSHDVSAAIVDYLPTTLRRYAAIPADLRSVAGPSGVSAHDSAMRQLDMLTEYVANTRQSLYADDLRQLEQQGAFLDAKWKKNSLDL